VSELATLTVGMVSLVTVGDIIGDSGQYAFVLLDEVSLAIEADASIVVDPPLVRANTIVMGRMAGFDVPDFIVVGGKPIPKSALVFLLTVNVYSGTGAIQELETYPEPVNETVNATARYLPIDYTLANANTQWFPYSEYQTGTNDGYTVGELAEMVVNEVMLLKVSDLTAGGTIVIHPNSEYVLECATGAAPQLLERYTYYRDGGMVRNGALIFDRGDHMWTDDIVWSGSQVTFVLVACLREPDNEWYGVMETANASAGVIQDILGVRYSRTGTLALWSDQVLAQVDLATGVVRPRQPVVIGLSLDLVTNEATLMSVDLEVSMSRIVLPTRIDPQSRLYLGRSPQGASAAANMDVLEFAYFETQMGPGDLHSVLAKYDRMYGVTTS